MMIITMASRYNVWIFSKKIVYTVYIRDKLLFYRRFFINCYYFTRPLQLLLLCFTSKVFSRVDFVYSFIAVAVDDESNIVD